MTCSREIQSAVSKLKTRSRTASRRRCRGGTAAQTAPRPLRGVADVGAASRRFPRQSAPLPPRCRHCRHASARIYPLAGNSKQGPNLHGIFGAKAGSVKTYDYSGAFKNADITWDED